MAKIREETREGALLVSKYRLEKLLGAGGMGEVYRAQNELIGRAVAIKVLRPEYSRNADVVQRFLREARAANMVRHANVVDVLDVGTDETGAPFIVQELLEGGDLATYIDRCGGKLGLRETLEVMRPVVEAVALAHSKGVVHRDLKPSNVFLDERAGATVPKVLDFGISKIATPAGEARMTATGAAMGTPAYMSPEQIQGSSQVDARTDVWALGVMLYELLSGRLPFEAPTSGGLFVKICTVDPTPFAQVAPDAPAVVGRVIERCLSRDPDGRYADASELAAALKQAQSTLPPPAHVARGSGSDPGIAKPRAELAATLEATGELVTGPTLAPAVRERNPAPQVAREEGEAVGARRPARSRAGVVSGVVAAALAVTVAGLAMFRGRTTTTDAGAPPPHAAASRAVAAAVAPSTSLTLPTRAPTSPQPAPPSVTVDAAVAVVPAATPGSVPAPIVARGRPHHDAPVHAGAATAHSAEAPPSATAVPTPPPAAPPATNAAAAEHDRTIHGATRYE